MIREFERDKIISYLMAKYPNKPVSVKFLNGEDGTYKKMFLDRTHHKYYRYNIIGNELYLAKVVVMELRANKVLVIGPGPHKKVDINKLKSNHGKINKSARTIGTLTVVALLAVGAAREIDKIETKNLDIPFATVIESEEREYENTAKEDTLKEESVTNEGEVHIHVEYQGGEYQNRERRLATDEIYGDIISYYTNRYGLPYSLTAALFSQERYYLDSSSLSTKRNVGSLTSINCEKIVVPVMENGEVVDYDKIYVLPKSYDQFKLEDLSTMIYDKKDLGDDLVKIREANKLQQEGYQIYCNRDMYEVKNNIKIACAYLRYLVDKKHDIIKGYMSYNIGQNRITDATTYEEILTGKIESNNLGDVFYLNHIAQYILSEEEGEDLTVNFTDGTSQTINIIKEDTLNLGAGRS